MRYSRMQDFKPGKKNGNGKGILFFASLFAVAAVVYFVGASKVGNFISEKVITPVISWATGESSKNKDTPSASAQPSVTTQTTTQEIKIENTSIYALQAGAFADESNAKTLATSLKEKGGAGYIYQEDAMYRVFIAAYASEEEAKNVQSRLETEQKVTTQVYELSSEAFTFTVTAVSGDIQSLQEAGTFMNTLQSSLLTDALELDKGSLTKEGIKEKVNTYLTQTQIFLTKIEELAKTTKNEKEIGAFKAYYQSAEATLKGVLENQDDSAYTSYIKSAYLSIGFAKKTMITSIKNQ